MEIRRVVTGHDDQGKAVFVSDERVAPVSPSLLPGAEFHTLWGGEETPRFPDAGELPDLPTYFPPVGGFRFGFFTLPPGEAELPADFDFAAAVAEVGESLPGLLGYMELDNPGMHTTDTIDFEVLLSGEVTLELDDGATVDLKPGDTVVQNGTRHRWINKGDVPAVAAVFMCGAHHDEVDRPG